MQSHQVKHSNLTDDINTARELVASLEWAWIPREKGKERAERANHALHFHLGSAKH